MGIATPVIFTLGLLRAASCKTGSGFCELALRENTSQALVLAHLKTRARAERSVLQPRTIVNNRHTCAQLCNAAGFQCFISFILPAGNEPTRPSAHFPAGCPRLNGKGHKLGQCAS